jgi:hypothetical protein
MFKKPCGTLVVLAFLLLATPASAQLEMLLMQIQSTKKAILIKLSTSLVEQCAEPHSRGCHPALPREGSSVCRK